jgi:hypothetical protein
MYSSKSHFALLLALSIIVAISCSPPSGDDAPAFIEVAPGAVSFSSGEDTASLLVKNTGDRALTFNVSVTASAEGIDWLDVKPTSGALDGRDAMLLTVRVVDSAQLVPETYDGTITVEGLGLDPIPIPVSLTVGQPILQVEPADTINFGTSETSKSIVIKNVGTGTLTYTVDIPDSASWLNFSGDLQKDITSNQPQTIEFTIDRNKPQWYGEGGAEILLTSNGLQDDDNSSTATIQIYVTLDDACDVDSDCAIVGHFCDDSKGSGLCTPHQSTGLPCQGISSCKSGFCEQGICCDTACEGTCFSCANEGSEGTCTPVANGTSCDEDTFCTIDETCTDGICGSGTTRDCSETATECLDGACDEKTDACIPGTPKAGWCFIDETCFEDGTTHPDIGCMECRSLDIQSEWSLKTNACFIGNICYTYNEDLGTCKICNPGNPDVPTSVDDGLPCTDDSNPCTADVCNDGKCIHNILTGEACDDGDSCSYNTTCDGEGVCKGDDYSCNDELSCTDAVCDGNGDCLYPVKDGWCLIGEICRNTDETAPDNNCLACRPEISKVGWSAVDIGTLCTDLNPCTSGDACDDSGTCKGDTYACEDHRDCTENQCDGEGGCSYPLKNGHCLIDSTCYDDGDTNGANVCLECQVEQNMNTWSNSGAKICNDDDPCTKGDLCKDGICAGEEYTCDDHIECTDNVCDGLGTCGYPVSEGYCFINENCIAEWEPHPNNLCQGCEAFKSQVAWSPIHEGDSCNDSDFCTVNDKCSGGVCTGSNNDCADTKTQCVDAVCSSIDQKCVTFDKDDGLECDDDAPCTIADQCDGGICAGLAKDCPTVDEAVVGCVAGECIIKDCLGHMGDCDIQLGNGCETDLYTTLNHCGECNDPCVRADFYANADVACSTGQCIFLGCHLGFADQNNNCDTGKNCVDGCEACQAVADGLTEIPDDGRDTNCDGEDTVNDESRGYYVDGSFPFGAQCPQPGQGTRACPFKHPEDAVTEALSQDWSDPYVVKREIYIAKGEYYGASPVVDATEPVQLIGGYDRTEAGPWDREDTPDPTLTLIEGDGNCTINLIHNRDAYGAIDGIQVKSKKICFGNGVFVKNTKFDHISADVASSLWIQESSGNKLESTADANYWVITHNTLGNISFNFHPPNNAPASIVNNDVSGPITLCGHSHQVLNNTIGQGIFLNYANSATISGNTITGDVEGSSWGSQANKVLNNSIQGSLIGQTEDWTVSGNTITGSFGKTDDTEISGWEITHNTVNGEVKGFFSEATMHHNLFEKGSFSVNANTKIYLNTIVGDLLLNGDKIDIHHNHITGNLTTVKHGSPGYYKRYHTIRSNLINGSVQVGEKAIIANNTVYVPSVETYGLYVMEGDAMVASNVFYWSGGLMTTRYAIKEGPNTQVESKPEVVILSDNIFIGFGDTGGVLLYDDNATPITSINVINTHSDLHTCGKGGNLAFDTKLSGEFVSISPSAEGFMMPTADSPFVDHALGLPYTCEDFSYTGSMSDLNGTSIPCGNARDMGCYEFCE